MSGGLVPLDPAGVRPISYGALFDAAAAAFPDRIAVEDVGGESLTYASLTVRVGQAAAYGCRLGLRPGDRAALLVGNGALFVELLLGFSRAGIICVLINPRQSADVLEHALRDSGARLAVVDEAECAAGTAAAHAAGAELLRTAEDVRTECARSDVAAQPWACSPGAPALIAYTSGSTGRPKGVILTHDGQIWSSRMHAGYCIRLCGGAAPTALIAVPMFHINALYGGLQPALISGGRIVIMPRFDASACLKIIAERDVHFMMGVPTMYAAMLAAADDLDPLDFGGFAAIFCGSAPGKEDMLEAFERRFGVRTCHVYGLTEGGPGVLAPPADGPRGPLASCGKPEAPEIEVQLVDSNGGAGDQGELYVRNPGLALGYNNLQDVTRQQCVGGWLG
ncbi:MAG: class I adenylate-forming enzyme family protein, partial [Pseudomonadota bacterium]